MSAIQQSLQKLNLKIVYPDNDILKDTVNIASANDLTIYDSLYIAVAKVYEAPLFTEDKKILSCRGKHKLIRHIKEFR